MDFSGINHCTLYYLFPQAQVTELEETGKHHDLYKAQVTELEETELLNYSVIIPITAKPFLNPSNSKSYPFSLPQPFLYNT